MISKWNNEMFSFSSSYLRKATNIAETLLCTHAFLGTSLDFTNFQHSKNIYQGLTKEFIFHLLKILVKLLGN